MADQLVTPQELASFLQLTWADLTAAQQSTMTMLAELATGKVQSACGQWIIRKTSTAVLDVDILDCDLWLDLPQSPVVSVATVLIDGVAYTDWSLRMQRLWRLNAWNVNASAPTQVTVTYTSGHADGAQALQLARSFTFALGASVWDNPSSATSERIDDYQITYAEAAARMVVTEAMRDQLREEYGRPAYVTSSRMY